MHNTGRRWITEVAVARREHQRWRFKIQVDAIEAVFSYNPAHARHEYRNARGLIKREKL
jgi:hypothetical protein